MKKQKKIKIVAVAGGLAFISLVFTLGLSLFSHPAQWAMAGVFAISAAVAIFLGVTIED